EKEPFLRDDLPDLVAATRRRCRRAVITISTNGLGVDRTVTMMHAIGLDDPSVRLAVSIDGLGAVHDRIRGVAGAFDRAMATVDRLRAEGYSGLRLSMTVTPDNAAEIAAVADLAAARELELGVVAAQAAARQLHTDGAPAGEYGEEAREAFEAVVGEGLRRWRPKAWLRAHFTAMTWRHICGERWENLSRPGEALFFLQSDGTVHTSSVDGLTMGNLLQQDFGSLWASPQAEQARQAERNRRHTSWMICTARRYYRCRTAAVGWWILRKKLRAHIGRLKLAEPNSAEEQTRANPAH
ncbi:MAG: hypothetical protein KGY81_05445, partial [Phycisphaerae bacterium]|nr:hypothetical protein [Phycisphaerae bacterium]